MPEFSIGGPHRRRGPTSSGSMLAMDCPDRQVQAKTLWKRVVAAQEGLTLLRIQDEMLYE